MSIELRKRSNTILLIVSFFLSNSHFELLGKKLGERSNKIYRIYRLVPTPSQSNPKPWAPHSSIGHFPHRRCRVDRILPQSLSEDGRDDGWMDSFPTFTDAMVFSRDSRMGAPDPNIPRKMGNPYISPITRGYLWVLIPKNP